MPEVSVIIPNYNHAPYLKQRIDSVLNQTFQDFEVIILDDRSPDNSREVIEQYKGHPKISHMVFNETNSGTTFKQWEKGISLAKGRYIWLAESDDWCENNLLEVLVSGMHNNDNCVLAYCQSHCIDNNLHIKWQSHHTELTEYFEGKDYIKKFLSKGNRLYNASMAIFKKESYFKISKEFIDFKFCGDWIFWAQIASQGDVFISAKPLNYFRKHGNDVSGGAFASGLYYIEDFKVLQLLKNKAYLDDELYQQMLISRYKKYTLARFKLKPDMVAQIDALFFNNHNYQWKLKLYKEAFKQKLLRNNSKLMNRWLS